MFTHSPPARPFRLRRTAFTLVELLVVIGIIALLISILLPALSKARESANTLKCLSNLRSIVQGCQAYSAENKGCIIPAQWQSRNGTDINNLDGELAWPNILAGKGYVTAPNSTGKPGPMTNSIFYCPSARADMADATVAMNGNGTIPKDRTDERASFCIRYQDKTGAAGGPSVDTWYGINGNIITKSSATTDPKASTSCPCRRITLDPTAPVQPAWWSAQLLKTSAVRKSADMAFFYDGMWMHHTSVNASRIAARHGNKTKTNIAFFDGHAETFTTADLPGGLFPSTQGKPAQIFALANLQAKYARPPYWILEQQ